MAISDFTRKPRIAKKLEDSSGVKVRTQESIRMRLESWISHLNRNPSAEDSSAQERRALLLKDLMRTVAESPDDVPIKYVIERLNRHWDD